MANPPPPYANITGISRTVMKDNAQESIGNYDGNARPGEIVADLTQDPPVLYIGNNLGQLTQLGTGGGGNYGNAQVNQYLSSGQVGNIIPSGNAVYSLGNSTNQWSDLYVANATIYMNNVPIGLTANNVLTVNGEAVLSNDSATSISTTGNITANNFSTLGISGNITGANVISANTFVIANSTELGAIEGANTVGFYTSDNAMQFLIEGPNNITWGFDVGSGGTGFPTLNIQRGDNPSGTIQGQTLLFGDPTQEAIISTRNGDSNFNNSQRLVINPGEGAADTAGEGGDIYLWAGRGGNASGSGGDIKIRGGQGGANTSGGLGGDGGYIRIEGGDAASTGGAAGYIELTGGIAGYGTPGVAGGQVTITGGIGQNGNGGDGNITGGFGGIGYKGGNVNITGGGANDGLASYGNVNINAGASTWQFTNTGTLNAPGAISAVGNITGGNIVTTGLITGNRTVAMTGRSVGIGYNSGSTTDTYSVGIGDAAGLNPGYYAIAIGLNAGNTQGGGAVAVGAYAGGIAQSDQAVAIGISAGANTQGQNSVAVGPNSGNQNQGNAAVAIGDNAGQIAQGVSAVAIGAYAGQNSQANNSIILNATGANLEQVTANTFTVAPVRNDVANTGQVVFYNTSSKEITYGNTISVSGNITGGNITTAGAGGDLALTGGNVTGANVVTANVVITTPTGLANLTATSGGRAFVNNANLIAAGNFGAQVGSGGSNIVPVWSDGSNWYIG